MGMFDLFDETFLGRTRRPWEDDEMMNRSRTAVEEEDNSPALEAYRKHLEQMPERKRSGGIRQILGTILETVSGPKSGARRLSERLKYPGYSDQMEDWSQKEQKLGGLAKTETEQLEAKRRGEEHRARMAYEGERTSYWQAQQDKQGMPDRKAYSSPSALKAAQLQQDLEGEDPGRREAAQRELDEIVNKGHPTGLTAQRFENRDTGEVTVKFYDREGNVVKTDTSPYGARPKPNMPTRSRRTKTITKEDDQGNVTITTIDENGKEISTITKPKAGKSRKPTASGRSSAVDELAKRLNIDLSGVNPADIKKPR